MPTCWKDENHVAHTPCDQATRTIARMRHLCAGCNAAYVILRCKIESKYHQKKKIKQTVSKTTNQIQRSKTDKNTSATKYNGTKCTEIKLHQKIQTHTGGMSENCSRLQSPFRHHFSEWQGHSAALGDEPSQMTNITSQMVGDWYCTSEQRSFTVSFVPLICLRSFVFFSFTQTQVVANRCALQQYVVLVLSFDSQCSAPWHAQYHEV